jgi:hypothetical protein
MAVTPQIADIADSPGGPDDAVSVDGSFWDVATVDEVVAMVESRRDAVAEGVGNNC